MADKNTCKISDLKQKIKRLSHLIKVSALLNSTLDLQEMLHIIMQSSKKVMSAEAATLFLYDEKENTLSAQIAYGKVRHKIKGKLTIAMGQGVAGWVAEHRTPILVNDPRNDKRFFCKVDKKTGFVTRSIICVPLVYQNRLVGVAQALNKKRGSFTEEDLEVFSTFANQAAIAIETARLHKEEMDVQRIEQELNLAQLIQNSFLPRIESTDCPDTEVGIRKKAAFNVSGDFFDIFPISSKKHFFLFGDVSGKGIPAALFMANLLSKVRYFVFRCSGLSEIIANLNSEIHRISQRGMFTTMVAGTVNLDNETITLSNCGHLPVAHFSASARRWRLLQESKNIPLGIFQQTEFAQETIPFGKNDALLLYSDGVTESTNRKGADFGLRRLSNALPKAVVPAQDVVDNVYDRLKKFCGAEEFHDDVTLFSIVNRPRDDRFETTIHSSPANLRSFRKQVESFLEQRNLDELTISRIVLAVDEAVTNIIKYSYNSRADQPIEICMTGKKTGIEVIIRDYGNPLDPSKLKIKDLEDVSPGGLGLNFIHLIMDSVQFIPLENGTRLIMFKYV